MMYDTAHVIHSVLVHRQLDMMYDTAHTRYPLSSTPATRYDV